MPSPRTTPSPREVTGSRVRARSSRRILDAARWFVELHGLEQLSMRRLAEAANVSVRTIYNLFGDKDGLVTALVQDAFDAMDVANEEIDATDPIERIWEAVTIAVATNCRYVPRAVVAAVVADPAIYSELGRRWRGRDLTLEAIHSAAQAQVLRDDLSPPLLVDHAGIVFLHLLRRWADGEIDEEALSAGVLHAFDVCLLAVARPRARAQLLAHATTLEPFLPHQR